MTDTTDLVSTDLTGTDLREVDLTGARLHRVRLTDARFRMVDLSGAVLRDVCLEGTEIDGEIDGLIVNGVDVAPLIEAELVRREPVRALLRAADPGGLRSAWAALQQSWATTCARVATLPAGTVDVRVDGEWSFAETLRHLVFATDAWLGGPFHPWGMPFTGMEEWVAAAELGVDPDARPSYDDVLALRADRVARVDDLLAATTPERLAEEHDGPPWSGRVSMLHSLHVILHEECEHHRFAVRDLDAIASGRA